MKYKELAIVSMIELGYAKLDSSADQGYTITKKGIQKLEDRFNER